MVLISQKRPAHVVLVKEFGRRMAVIDGEQVTSLEPAANFADPVARFQPCFGVLALAQNNTLRRKILGDGTSRKRRQNIHKVPVAEAGENLFQRATNHHDPMYGQRIDQLVGKEAACGDVGWNFGPSGKVPGGRMALGMHRGLLAPRRGALHRGVAQDIIKSRELRLAKIENVASEPPGAGPRLNKRKFRRTAKTFPHLSELSRQETGKDGMHVDTCVVVCETLGLRFAVIAVDRMVEAFAHVVRERKRAEAANAVGK